MNASRLIIVGLLAISLSCQTKPKQEATTASDTATEQPDSAANLAKRPGPDSPRTAADRLIRALYFEHNAKENPFREKKNRTLIDQFFAKSTADLIWNDAQKASGKVNRTKTNLLFNAPDAAVKKTWVEPAAIGGKRAIVYVTFQDNGKPQEVKVDMNQVDGGRWRITEMFYPDGKQLTQLLK
ncbi:hypothetical protein [Spirosoma endbachense]|uniref:DUF3828 domain-containing protein n=1 Tax=Spirosoma endbachense TaxID=2666025 RepID=A0A6P1VZ80_9BACT|nr:hypothetical protein [Spirosoma endbachense]QHV98095.1 hypothetical protein GJR95_25175 [Spirosoma endbachense]